MSVTPFKKIFEVPPFPPHNNFFGWKRGVFSKTLDMTSDGLEVMFEGDSADTCAEKFPLMSMGDRAEGLACADPGARTPIGASGNSTFFFDQFSRQIRQF